MSFGQPSAFGVLNNSQSAPSSAFSRSNSIAAAGQGPAEVLLGDEVQESESDAIGYVALAGELKAKVFEGQYPENDLPIPSSSLLSISQKRQLFAAAGPHGVVVARTSTLRATFKNTSTANGNLLPFQPECIIPMTIRLSHVAFTVDGNFLLLGAQVGGIAVYSVDDILSKGSQVQPQCQITTGPLLEMKPIPTLADAEKVCILVGSGWSQGGTVGLVDVKTQQVQGNLKSGVTTISWSPKGKQIICGGSGGGLAWIRPNGSEADVVPGVPNYPNYFVSSIYWIESEVIFVVVTPKMQPGSQTHDNESIHFVMIREGKKHTFYRINDMTAPFGMSSRPTYHNFIHLKAWEPNMKDCLILSNTCSADIGTVLRLSNSPFTPTSILSDGRRATLPMSTDGSDTTPLGLALDLTAPDGERVVNPFPNIEQSATSLPCMWVLTNEGVISAYWVVYSDAIKIGNSSAAYPELLAYESQQPPQTPQRATGPGFGQSGFGASKPAFGQPSTPTSTFGQPSKPSAFGQPATSAPAFGQASQPTSTFGQPSASTSTFGQPSTTSSVFGQPSKPSSAFGQPSTAQPVFGQSAAPHSAFGQTSTPQSTFGQTSAAKPAFGQPAFGSSSTLGRPGMSSGAFGSASTGGTGAVFGGGSAFGSQAGAPAFGQKAATPAFGSTSALGGSAPAFGSTTALGATRPAAFGQPAFGSAQPSGTGFGQTSQLGSKLSTFGSAAASGDSSGFAKFSGGGGFLGSGNTNTSAPAAFLQSSGSSNPFASKQPDTFGSLKSNAPTTSAFGSSTTTGFAMASAFGSNATPDANKPLGGNSTTGAFGSAFGSSLGNALSQPSAPANVKDDEMADSDDEVEQPRAGVRGGNMFDVASALTGGSEAAPAKDTTKSLAPAFGQPQAATEPAKPSAFGTGLFGSAMNKDQPKGAFGSASKAPTLAPAFGTQESKTTAPASAFASPSPEKAGGQVGTGLFGSTLQTTSSGAQPTSAFGTTTKPSTSAFGSVAPASAFGGVSAPAKSVVSAFNQKIATPAASPGKSVPKDDATTAASKGLPDDDSDNETVPSPSKAESAPLPPDFTTKAKKPEIAVSDDAPLPPDFASQKPVPAATGATKTPLPGSAPRTPLPASFTQSKEATAPSTPPANRETIPKAEDGVKSIESPLKNDNYPQSPVTASGTSKNRAPNPMAARRGAGLRSTNNPIKVSNTGRASSQKAGAVKGAGEGSSGGFKFMGTTTLDAAPVAVGSSIFDQYKSSEPILSFEQQPVHGSDDDSDSDDEDGSEDASADGSADEAGSDVDESGASEEPSDRSSELGEDSWINADEEDSPTQTSNATKKSQKGQAAGLFGRMGPPVSSKPGTSAPKQSLPSKSLDVSKLLNKAPSKSPEPTKAPTIVPPKQTPLSPRALALQKQEADDKRRADDCEKHVEQERKRMEQLSIEKEKLLAQAQFNLEMLKRQQQADAKTMNDREKAMNDREAAYREDLQKPLEQSSVLKQLIPYRETAPFTNFKGHDAFMEHLIITLDRRVDNFGMNMRHLEAFVAYQRESDHFTLDDKRSVDNIRIKAAPDVSMMARDLIEKAQEMDKAFDLESLKANVTSLINDVDYLCARASDIPNIILLHTHPELRAHIRRRPLSAQQRMQQASLRRKVPLLRRKVKRAEDNFRVLQARVASLNKNQKANYGDIRPPTIEQVRETVARLTEVAKEKAERIDNLEDALRKMRIRSVSPAMSRGTTPSFRAGSVSFSISGRDRERGGTPAASGWKSAKKGKDSIFATPPRNMPGPDKFDYYENTIDSPISRFPHGKQNTHKSSKSLPGMFGLIEEELGDDEYFNDQNASSSMNVPIATSYDRGMAELRKEVLTTPKKGNAADEVPNTPASRQVNRLLRDEMEEITGGRARRAWNDADDYVEDKKLRKEVGKRMAKVVRKVGVKTTKVEV
ncbi:hypothetical protein H072_10104 [Dactylellina haptotyla CBS 200.50]|uniref:Nucleoporin Nup159/Nup146 N-terminal domain-containing protein n=1 Tax=Dactylellina haptotyla (strain CBS 200.50) TaxID=1284197 RepID=S8A106_DACHA|nr:hypothetical protein H072_10104 [Dactylellina haptotyla CBS 200.50]